MELLDKFKQLEENVSILKEIKSSITKDELLQNKRLEWELRYGFFESIQIIIDIACKISANYNLGNPKNYRECIELLCKYRYIDEDLTKRVTSMIGFRNLLIHEYAIIEKEKLFMFLEYIDDFTNFSKQINEHF